MNTARIWCISIAIWVLVGCVSSQTLVTECVHRDSTGHVIYLENEYRDGDTSFYYCAYSDGARLLKQWTRYNGDTLIEFYRCHELNSRPYPNALGDEWVIAESLDSTWFSLSDAGVVVWDTVMPLKEGQAFFTLMHRYDHDYAALVLTGEIPVELGKARVRETWEYRTHRGRSIGLRIYGVDGQLTNRQYFTYHGDALVSLSFFDPDTIPYAVDSITWYPDTSAMHVVNQWLDDGERSKFSLHIKDDSTIFVSATDTIVNEWVYDRPPWSVRLREAALREGPLCYSRIVRMRLSLPRKSCSSNGSCTVSEHSWDQNGRLVGSKITRNGRFERQITYSYP